MPLRSRSASLTRRALALSLLVATPHLLHVATAPAQEAAADESTARPSSDGSMQGFDLGRTRLFRTRAPRDPKSLEQRTQKLFELKKEYLYPDSESAYGPSNGYWHSSDGDHFTAPVVAGDTVYFTVSAGDGYVYALDKGAGERRWRFKAAREKLSALAVAGGAVYLATDRGTFFALDAATGRVLWEASDKGRGGFVAPPAVHDGVVYFSVNKSSKAGAVYALDAGTGRVVWQLEAKWQVTSPAIAGGTLYAGGDRLLALDAKTGREKWSVRDDDGFLTVAAQGGTIFFSDLDGALHAVSAAGGKPEWKADKKFKTRTMLAVGNDTVYFGGRKDGLHALDAATGRERWTFRAKQKCGAPSLAEGFVYFSCGGELIRALDALTGEEKWKFRLDRKTTSAPTISDGVLYLLRSDGYMYTLR